MPSRVDLPHLLRRSAQNFPDQIAVADAGASLTLAALVELAERFANALDALLPGPGNRVAILSENRWEYPVVDIGLLLARQVRVALNARLQLEEHSHVIADSGARILIYSDTHAGEAEVLRERHDLILLGLDAPSAEGLGFAALLERAASSAVVRTGDIEDAAWITYTAGTTGRSKGVVLSQRAIREVAFNLLLELGPVAPGETIVLPQALSHGAGYFLLPWLLSGGGVHLLREFDPEQIIRIGRQGLAATLKCVPAMLPPLVAASAGAGCGFRSIIYGASPISRPILETSLDTFGPILTQIYGQSEAPATLTCLAARDHLGLGDSAFSAGRPWRNVAIEIRGPEGTALKPGEEGEVVVAGPHLMTGYHKLSELTAEVLRDGWLRTRDRGFIDAQGFVHLRGRLDDLIVSGGHNISPREVEDALCGLEAVEEVSVIGLADERWGTKVAAAVKLRRGGSATRDDILAFGREQLGFRSPKLVRIVEEIPKTAYGKVDRRRLAELLSAPEPAR